MKKLIVAAIAALVFAAPASAWRSNEFVSPSGNIQCAIWQADGKRHGITCRVDSRDRQFVIGQLAPAFEVYNWEAPAVTFRYVLEYGETYTAGKFFCRSFSIQLICGNRDTGHGFSLSREKIRLW